VRRSGRQNAAIADDLTAGLLLALPVRLHGIPLGQPVDVVLDLESKRAIGVEVLCGDGARRYLPLAAAHVRDDEIAIRSALVLFDERELAWYRRRAHWLGSLRGAGVQDGGRELGPLADVLLGPDGAVLGLLVGDGGRTRRVELAGAVTIDGRDSASAA
jgi:hypothetical protein